VRAARVPDVLDLIGDREPNLADSRLDAPAQHEALAEHRGLQHLALGPQHALIACPALAVPEQSRRQPAGPPVQPVGDALQHVRLIEMGRRVPAGYQRVVQAAGHHHPAAPGAEPAPLVWLVVPGRDHARGRLPAQRQPGELASADIETAVDQHVEREAAAGTELKDAHAAAEAIAEGHQPDSRGLLQPANPPQQFGPAPLVTEQIRHVSSRLRPAGRAPSCPRGTRRRQPPAHPRYRTACARSSWRRRD
jgi:hypothetical protein